MKEANCLERRIHTTLNESDDLCCGTEPKLIAQADSTRFARDNTLCHVWKTDLTPSLCKAHISEWGKKASVVWR